MLSTNNEFDFINTIFLIYHIYLLNYILLILKYISLIKKKKNVINYFKFSIDFFRMVITGELNSILLQIWKTMKIKRFLFVSNPFWITYNV